MSLAKQKDVKDRDRGVVLVWFALSAVAIIGIGALVIDVGAMWSERRQLTNGADASAMAVGIEAAVNNPGAQIGPQLETLAETYANVNAKDNFSFLEQLCGVGPGLSATAADVDPSTCSAPAQTADYANWAYVKLRTLTPSNGDQVKFLVAPLLDAANVGTTLRGAATVAWGVTNGIQVVSMVIGECVFQDTWVNNGVISFPITDSYGPIGRSPVVNMQKDLREGGTCPAPQQTSYPTGWEYSTNIACKSDMELVNGEYRLRNSTEGQASNKCQKLVQPNLNKPLLVAIVSNYVLNEAGDTCSGNNGDVCYYVVKGLATFQFCGYSTQGFGQETNQCPTTEADALCPVDGAQPKDGIICGYFVPGSVTEGDILNTVGSPSTGDFGTRVVKFIG